MSVDEIQKWILVISGAVTMLSLATGVWLSLREYRLKLRAEARAQESAEVESEIRLNTLFQDLMRTANGRSGYVVSDKAIEFILKRMEDIPIFDTREEAVTVNFNMIDVLNQAAENFGILRYPVGSAEQDSSVAAIFSLASHYPRLRQTALCALEGLQAPFTTKVAVEYTERLRHIVEVSGNEPAEPRKLPRS